MIKIRPQSFLPTEKVYWCRSLLGDPGYSCINYRRLYIKGISMGHDRTWEISREEYNFGLKLK